MKKRLNLLWLFFKPEKAKLYKKLFERKEKLRKEYDELQEQVSDAKKHE